VWTNKTDPRHTTSTGWWVVKACVSAMPSHVKGGRFDFSLVRSRRAPTAHMVHTCPQQRCHCGSCDSNVTSAFEAEVSRCRSAPLVAPECSAAIHPKPISTGGFLTTSIVTHVQLQDDLRLLTATSACCAAEPPSAAFPALPLQSRGRGQSSLRARHRCSGCPSLPGG